MFAECHYLSLFLFEKTKKLLLSALFLFRAGAMALIVLTSLAEPPSVAC